MMDPFFPDAESESPPRFLLDIGGLCSGAHYIPSPNCDHRPDDCEVKLLVLHNISLPPGEFGGPGIIDLFTNRLDPSAHEYYATLAGLRVSSHFLIRRDGEVLQFVPCELRAWHAGVSQWNGRECCNDFSVGVELEGTDDLPYADAQYAALTELILALRCRYGVLDMAGHSDIAPQRKTDPGPAFDWLRLHRALL